ncbi:Skn-1-like basic-leucine zipper transcription factor [Phycomyces blakesleeanus]|uniref:Skn-1-like basic-leucine zipper transcription factor n=2 Tax=Phycomyces blakesleeanus TaxID=4837 RepID=A0A162U288_PHYB8|nr:Skn-1-like basic-leucine zipper transcription factor [Phycomyces blakesleeanus NRRL 1555(-)]OAD72902.1 Skn-1-like basic-leucine zipper transcription factor [Phycomyces blakesleeanus NRRL 1555(-)]|eukprot:XP_018290942.1 Skn-1-like basic-leucine zipper transcription factor [Phycomyces blakesleeanus NRRL 1555(-)]
MESSQYDVQPTDAESISAMLSMPVNFTIDPLVTVASPVSQDLFSSSREPSPVNSEYSSVKNITPRQFAEELQAQPEPSPTTKEQKAKERVLRNRAAAQESRDKKRRYVATLESTNEQLKQENDQITKRAKLLEAQNEALTTQLEAFSRQLAELQAQVKSNSPSSFMFHGFCDSARIANRLKSLF